MFRKYQEFTMKFFFDSGLSDPTDDLSFAGGFYILIVLAEVISLIACIIWICSEGFTNFTTPWAIVTAIFWGTAALSTAFSNKYKFTRRTNYDKLPAEEKRYIFKASILLFIHLMSCGVMIAALPVMLVVGTANAIIDGVSKCLFPDPVKEKSSAELSSQFDTILK